MSDACDDVGVAGYTSGMKTAVSVPDDVFERVDRLARRAGRSRSEVYSAALREYLARHTPDEVTEALDRIVGEIGEGLDPFTREAGRRGVWWADLPAPEGSAPGFRRPVVVVQGDAFNRSALRTALCVPLTSNLRWAEAPGNVLLTARSTGLPRDSGANISQLVTLDRSVLVERVGKLSRPKLDLVLAGIDVVLGR